MRRIVGLPRLALAGLALAGAAAPGLAQDETPAPLAFGDFQVEPLGPADRVSVSDRNGQQELTITRTGALLEGVEFSQGVIEFDVAFDERRGFGGLVWHVSNDNDGEYFYLRKHKSGMPDAGQYTPFRGGLTSWQIFTDANAIAPFSFTHEGWNRIKFVIADDKADIYFNGSTEPVLHVPDLASDRGTGRVGFRTSGPFGELTIANLTIRPLESGEGIVGTPKQVPPPPSGVIANWNVSERFAEARVDGVITLPAELAAMPVATELAVEPTGIVDLSRAGRPEEEADTLLVSTRIVSDAAKPVRLNFGYSDRLRLFLNGELLFDGVAGWRSRDFFFLGTIGFKDAVVLNLREGENTLQAAVSETFGGWGFAGAIENGDGLTVHP